MSNQFEEQNQKEIKKRHLLEERLKKDMIEVLSTPSGRRILQFIISKRPKTAVVTGSTELTYYKLGQTEFVDSMVDWIKRIQRPIFMKMEDEFSSVLESIEKQANKENRQ